MWSLLKTHENRMLSQLCCTDGFEIPISKCLINWMSDLFHSNLREMVSIPHHIVILISIDSQSKCYWIWKFTHWTFSHFSFTIRYGILWVVADTVPHWEFRAFYLQWWKVNSCFSHGSSSKQASQVTQNEIDRERKSESSERVNDKNYVNKRSNTRSQLNYSCWHDTEVRNSRVSTENRRYICFALTRMSVW